MNVAIHSVSAPAPWPGAALDALRATVFIVRQGELGTSTGAYSFKGITQKNVFDAWTAAGGVARECDFTLAQRVLGR